MRGLGYAGGYDAVRRYARARRRARGMATSEAFVPLSFAPGEAYQFDWSHEIVVLNGVTTTVKVAHVRLCHSRMLFVRAYPRESQEMVFDAHDRAFAFFRGACVRGIYDNMKTAVETVFIGKDRAFNRRFAQMCSHYLVEPDWGWVHRELRRPDVTLALLWEEYRAGAADGFGYSWFCDLYRARTGRLKPTMRQVHVAGERMFVDFAGRTGKVVDAYTGETIPVQIFVAVPGASSFTYYHVPPD